VRNLALLRHRGPRERHNTYEDLRRDSRRRLPRMVFDFVDGGADGELTLGRNRSAFADVMFSPRFLRDVSAVSTATTVLGEHVPLPFILAPAGLASVVHPEGELAVARAAAAAGTIFCISTASSYAMEDIAAAAPDARLWFQLYLWRDERVVGSLVDRARDIGCRALVLTIDVPAVGKRERDLANGMSIPPRIRASGVVDALRRPRWLRGILTGPELTFGNLRGIAKGDSAATIGEYTDRELVDRTVTWERLRWLRERWDGPIAVKGIMNVADARQAVSQGADAVYVSNHGGRQLDSVPGTAAVLPRIVEAVGDQVEVLIDGGIRRGEDIVKACALGARAALGGRPWFHALAADGERGVRRMLEVLRSDVARTQTLLGVADIREVDPSSLDRA
jgi:L-lactate dehydrogenase (cytochrome)